MSIRTPFTWNVTLAADNAQTIERKFTAFWSPEKTSSESIALSCAAQETAKAKGKRKFFGIGAQLVTA